MSNYLKNTINVKETPQTEPVPGVPQVQNKAGGYVFPVTPMKQLQRWLILGSEGGTYYVGQYEHTKDNVEALKAAVTADGLAAVKLITEISEQYRAPKNDQALFALAYCMTVKDDVVREAAYAALPRVARTGTHLFMFCGYVDKMRGWGRALRRCVAEWYTQKEPDKVAYQMVKYQNREGWTHRDVLRMSHPDTRTEAHNALFGWACGKVLGGDAHSQLPNIVRAFEMAKSANMSTLCDLIRSDNLTHEMIPTEWLKLPAVWNALLAEMPMMAMVRNLGRMGSVGLLTQFSNAQNIVVSRLSSEELLRSSRIHPISLLVALLTYKQGHGTKGKLKWDVVPQVVEALESAFYASFRNVEPTGKRFYLALDVSTSMCYRELAGVSGLTPEVAACAMAMVTARTEHNYYIAGFAHELRQLPITSNTTLPVAMRITQDMSFGGTDAAIPIKDALAKRMPVDVFAIYSDGETWAGDEHVFQALKQYRDVMGIPAKLVNVAMTSTAYGYVEPEDGGSLDVFGFDTTVPQIIGEFVGGRT